MVGDNADLIVLLLHITKEIELNTAQLYFRTKKCTGTSLFLLHCVRKKPFMRHILSFYSVSGCNSQHDFQDIYEGQKSYSESLKLTQSTRGQLLCLTTVMCLKQSKLLLLSPHRLSLQPFMQQIKTLSENTSRCSDLDPSGYGFHPTRGMLLLATHTNIQASSFPVPYRCYFCKCKGNFDANT